MTQGVKDLIQAIVEGDAANIDAAFNAEMATRVSDRLEDLRVSVAQNMFKTEAVAEEVDAEDGVESDEVAAEDTTEESAEQVEDPQAE